MSVSAQSGPRKYLGHGLWASHDREHNVIRLYGAADTQEFLWCSEDSFDRLHSFADEVWGARL